MKQSALAEGRPGGRVADALRTILEPIGMFDAEAAELPRVRELAARLIGPCIAEEDVLRAIHDRSGYGVYVVREAGRVAGTLALIFLNREGLAAIEADAFDPLHPPVEMAVLPDEEPACVYAWGIAADTREAAGVLVAGSWALGAAVPNQPFFVRAATEAGRRLLIDKMDFTPYPASSTGMLWTGPRVNARRAA